MRVGALILFAGFLIVGEARAQNVSERYLVAAANLDREKAGLPTLQVDLLLAQAARAHAQEMADRGEISHQFAGEPDLAARAGAAGVRFSLITENVAEASTSLLIHELWMQSSGHRANLLDPAVDRIGIAVVAVHGQLYAVEDFARTVPHLSREAEEQAVEALITRPGLALVQDHGDARQTCQRETGYSGARLPWFVMRFTASSLDHVPAQLAERLASGKYREAAIGACVAGAATPFTTYRFAVLLYP